MANLSSIHISNRHAAQAQLEKDENWSVSVWTQWDDVPEWNSERSRFVCLDSSSSDWLSRGKGVRLRSGPRLGYACSCAAIRDLQWNPNLFHLSFLFSFRVRGPSRIRALYACACVTGFWNTGSLASRDHEGVAFDVFSSPFDVRRLCGFEIQSSVLNILFPLGLPSLDRQIFNVCCLSFGLFGTIFAFTRCLLSPPFFLALYTAARLSRIVSAGWVDHWCKECSSMHRLVFVLSHQPRGVRDYSILQRRSIQIF